MVSNVYDYIKDGETNFKLSIPLTNSKDWNFQEHVERCFNVANGWYHKNKNDGSIPFDDIVTPIIDVAFRSEGFDVKDIVPFIDSVGQEHKSHIIKKYHPVFARNEKLDDFIDETVETSIIYDLVLFEETTNILPTIVPLQKIAFLDQTDALAGSICIKHQYTISELLGMKGKWDNDKIDYAITLSKHNKTVSMANDKEAKTSGNYIEIYELNGFLPANWIDDNANPDNYSDQLHIVCFYLDTNGDKKGLTLYSGKNKAVKEKFKALKIDKVRSFGRACGRSIVERLFEPQVWNNYSTQRIKEMLDIASIVLATTNSERIQSERLTDITGLRVLKTDGNPVVRLDTNTAGNMNEFMNHKTDIQRNARMLGSASEGQLGVNPSSGTPFALEELIVNQGEDIHKYRRGKIATFFADELYPDWIIPKIVAKLNSEIEFSSDLSLDEKQEIANLYADKKVNELIIKGQILFEDQKEEAKQKVINEVMKSSRNFFKTMKDEFKDLPVKVKFNIAGKQKYMAKTAESLSRLISNILANPEAFAQIPSLGKVYNQLIESAGLNPIDFNSITQAIKVNPILKTRQLKSPVTQLSVEQEQALV